MSLCDYDSLTQDLPIDAQRSLIDVAFNAAFRQIVIQRKTALKEQICALDPRDKDFRMDYAILQAQITELSEFENFIAKTRDRLVPPEQLDEE